MSQHPVVFEIAYAPLSLTTNHIRELFETETDNGVTCITEETCKQVRRLNGKKHTIKYKQFIVNAICKRFIPTDEDKNGRIVRYFTYMDSQDFICEAKIRISVKHH
jgi:hypothetical protein